MNGISSLFKSVALIGLVSSSVSCGSTGRQPIELQYQSSEAALTTPTQLAFVVQPADAVAGSTLAAIKVAVADANGNVVTTAANPVKLTLTGPGAPATLGGTATVGASAGVASFSTLKVSKAAVFTLTATSGTLTSAVSGSFTIAPAAPSKLSFTVQPTDTVPGVAIAPAVQVTALDAFNNVATNASPSISLALSANPSGATLSGAGPIAATAGVATFPAVTLNRAGINYALRTSATGLTAATSTAFSEPPAGYPWKLAIVAQPGPAQAGATLSVVTVQVQDSRGTLVPTAAATISLALSGSAALAGTTTLATIGGSASFTDLSVDKTGGFTITASSGTLLPATTASFTISPGPAASLAFDAQPVSALAGAHLAPAVRVSLRDAFGNVVTSSNASLSMAIAANPGGATLSGATTVAAVAGVASFSTLSLDKAAAGYTLAASAAGLATLTSGAFDIAPAAAKTLAIVSGTPQTGTVGVALPAPLVVRVTDAFGNPVAGRAITWAVTSGGGSISPASATTAGDGTAQAAAVPGNTAGVDHYTATSSGLTGSPTTFTATGVAGPATQLIFTVQPANRAAGATFGATVALRDQFGNTALGSNAPVSIGLANNPTGATLLGNTTVNAAAGVATFSGLSIDNAGVGYTLAAGSAGIASATSSAFNISAAAASKLALVSGDGQSATAGASLGAPFVARVQDAFGNPVAGRAVTFAVASGGGSIAPASATSAADGTVRASATLGTAAGADRFTFTSAGLSGSPLSFNATAVAGAPAKLAFAQQPTNVTAGMSISPTVKVVVEDQYGNPTAATSAVTVALASNPGGATLSGTTTSTASSGVASYADLSLDKAAAGYTLAATASGLASATSAAFTVSSAAARSLVLVSGDGQTGVVGTALPQPLAVKALDAFANGVAGVTVLFSASSGGGSVSSASRVTTAAGAQVTGTLGHTAGADTFRASATGLLGSPVTFSATALAGAAVRMTLVSGSSQAAVVGSALAQPLVVRVTDTFLNPVAGTTVSWTAATGGGSIAPPSSVSASDGTSSAAATVGTVTGANTFRATSAGLTGSPVSFAATAIAGAPAQLAFRAQPTDVIAGLSISPSVKVAVLDQYGNVVTTPVRSVTVALASNPGGATLSGTRTASTAAGVATFTNLSLNKAADGYTLAATSGALPAATSAAFNVTAAAAQNLALVSGSGQTGPAGSPLAQPLVVSVTDRFGNPVQGTAVSWTGLDNGAPDAASTSSDTDGTAQVTAHLCTTVGACRYQATAVGLTGSPVTFAETTTAAAPASISAVSGNYQTAVVGSTLAPFTVLVVDAFGNPTPGILVNWTDPSGSTISQSTSDSTGHASASVQLGDVAGPSVFTASVFTATAGLLSATFTATGTPAAPARVVFVAQPSEATAGADFTPPPQVQIEDGFGNPVTTSTAQVTISLEANPGDGSLVGAIAVDAVNGVATFAGVSLRKAAMGYQLRAASNGLASADGDIFDVKPAAPAQLVFGPMPTQVVAGIALSPPVTVQVQDSFGNPVPELTANVTVEVGTNPGSDTLLGTLAQATVDSVATFADLALHLAGTGYTLVASDDGDSLPPATSPAFDVIAGPAVGLVFTQRPVAWIAGSPQNPPIAIQLVDEFDNLAVDPASVTVTATSAEGGSLIGDTTQQTVAGVATFAGLKAELAGTYELQFDPPELEFNPPDPPSMPNAPVITVSPAAPATLDYRAGDGQTGTVGLPLPIQLLVRVADTYGNPVPNAAVDWAATIGGGSIAPYMPSTDASGLAQATATLGPMASAQQFQASSQGHTFTFMETAALTCANPPCDPMVFTVNGQTVDQNSPWAPPAGSSLCPGVDLAVRAAPVPGASIELSATLELDGTTESFGPSVTSAGDPLSLGIGLKEGAYTWTATITSTSPTSGARSVIARTRTLIVGSCETVVCTINDQPVGDGDSFPLSAAQCPGQIAFDCQSSYGAKMLPGTNVVAPAGSLAGSIDGTALVPKNTASLLEVSGSQSADKGDHGAMAALTTRVFGSTDATETMTTSVSVSVDCMACPNDQVTDACNCPLPPSTCQDYGAPQAKNGQIFSAPPTPFSSNLTGGFGFGAACTVCTPGPTPSGGTNPTARGWGDPHITTPGGHSFTSLELGEFTYASAFASGGIALQARHQRLPGFQGWASFVTAAAVKAAGHTFEVRLPRDASNQIDLSTHRPLEQIIDGQPAQLQPQVYVMSPNLSFRVAVDGGLEVYYEDPLAPGNAASPNSAVTIVRLGTANETNLLRVGAAPSEPVTAIDVKLITAAPYQGVLGNGAGDAAKDFLDPYGTIHAQPDLGFMNGWRVNTAAQSLFTYVNGESPATFNVRQTDSLPVGSALDPLNARVQAMLTGTCGLSADAFAAVSSDFVYQMALELAAGRTEKNLVANGICTDEHVVPAAQAALVSLSFGGKVTVAGRPDIPVAGARVRVLAHFASGDRFLCDLTSTQDGRWECTLSDYPTDYTGLTSLPIELQLTGRGPPQSVSPSNLRVPTPGGATVVITQDFSAALANVLDVTGTVTDPQGLPLAGAELRISAPVPSAALADANGNYEMLLALPDGLTSGQVQIQAAAKDGSSTGTLSQPFIASGGIQQVSLDVKLQAVPGNLPPVQSFRQVNFTGKVTNLLTAQIGQPSALAGYSITVQSTAFAHSDCNPTTSALDGSYSCIVVLRSGDPFTATIQVMGQTAAIPVSFSADQIPGPGELVTSTLDFPLTPTTVLVTGTATTPAGPLAGANVDISADAQHDVQAITGSDGSYSAVIPFASVAQITGTLSVRVSLPGAGGASPASTTVTQPFSAAGALLTTINADVSITAGTGVVTGQVLNALVGSLGVPVAQVAVLTSATELCSVSTDASGLFSCPISTAIGGVIPLTFVVSGRGSGTFTSFNGVPATADLTSIAPGTVQPLLPTRQLTVSPTTLQLSGTVRDSTGSPVAGASVGAGAPSAPASTTQTAADGTYALTLQFADVIASAAVSVSASYPGLAASATARVSLTPSALNTATQDLTLPGPAQTTGAALLAFSGTAFNALVPGAVLPLAHVEIRAAGQASSFCKADADANGAWFCKAIFPSAAAFASFEFHLFYAGAEVASPLVVTDSFNLGTTIESPLHQNLSGSPTTLRVRGHVSDGNGTAFPGAEVSLTGSVQGAAIADGQGDFELVAATSATIAQATGTLTATVGTLATSLPLSAALVGGALTDATQDLTIAQRFLSFTGDIENSLAPGTWLRDGRVVLSSGGVPFCSAALSAASGGLPSSFACPQHLSVSSAADVTLDWVATNAWGTSSGTLSVPADALPPVGERAVIALPHPLELAATALALSGTVFDSAHNPAAAQVLVSVPGSWAQTRSDAVTGAYSATLTLADSAVGTTPVSLGANSGNYAFTGQIPAVIVGGALNNQMADITLVAVLPVVTGLQAAGGPQSVTLTWTASPGATSYNVYSSPTLPVTTNSSKSIVSSAPATVTGLVNGIASCFAVSGVNAAGEGPLSSPACATPSGADTNGLTPYDSLSSGTLDGALWEPPGAFSRGVVNGAAVLSVDMANEESRWVKNAVYSTNAQINAGAQRVTSLIADVLVPSATTSRSGGAIVKSGVRLNYSPPALRSASAQGNLDALVAEVGLMDSGQGPRIYRQFSHCDNPSCTSISATDIAPVDPMGFSALGDGIDVGAPAAYDTSYTVGLSLDEATGLFHWSVSGGVFGAGVSGTADPTAYLTATPGWSGVPLNGTGFANGLLIVRSTDWSLGGGGSAAVSAQFRSVHVGFNNAAATLYDDFSGTNGDSGPRELSGAKWLGGGANSVALANGSADLHLQSTASAFGGLTLPGTYLVLNNPSAIDTLQLDANIAPGSCLALYGRFYNDGTPGNQPGSLLGEIGAEVSVCQDAAGASASWVLERGTTASTQSSLANGTLPVSSGPLHTPHLAWDAATRRFIFGVDGQRTIIDPTAYAQYAGPANMRFLDILLQPHFTSAITAGTTYTFDAKINNVFVAGASPGQPLPAPTGLVAIATGANVSLSWDAQAGVTWEIWRGAQPGAYQNKFASLVNAYFDTTATAGNTYEYVVVAVTGTEASLDSAPASVTLAPPAPTFASGAYDSSFNPVLSWTAANGATTYKLSRTPPFASAVAVAAPALSYTDATVTHPGIFSYALVASNAGGDSASSGSQTVPVPPLSLAGPTNVQVALAFGVPHLSWAPDAQATRYGIFRGPSLLGELSLLSVSVPGGGSASWDDASAVAGQTYFYAVASISADAASTAQQAGSVTIPLPTLAPVTALQATGGCRSVSLSWTASPSATSYLVTRDTSPSGSFSTVVAGNPSGTTTLTLVDTDAASLASNSTFYYRVVARNDGGESPSSPTVQATTVLDAPVLGLYAGDTQVSLYWQAPPGTSAGTSYDVLRASAAAGPFTPVKTGIAATSMTDIGLTPSTAYFYSVRAGALACVSPALDGTTGASGSAITQLGGTQVVIQFTDFGVDAMTEDLSGSTFSAVSYDAATNSFIQHLGVGTTDGYFTIPNVPTGVNQLTVADNHLSTDVRQFDLSYVAAGRLNLMSATLSTPVTVQLDGLVPWDSSGNDHVEVVSLGAALDVGADSIPYLATGAVAPAAGATSASLADQWLLPAAYGGGLGLIDTAQGDQIYLTQDSNVTASPFSYGAVQRFCAGAVNPATMADGAAATISCAGGAAMTPVPLSTTTTLNFARSQFKSAAVLNAVAPASFNPTFAADYVAIWSLLPNELEAAIVDQHFPFVGIGPALMELHTDPASTDLSETITYGNPLPSSLSPYYAAGIKITLSLTAPATGACPAPAVRTFNDSWWQFDQLSSGQFPGTISPATLPVTDVGLALLPSTTSLGGGQPLKVSWSPPAGAANPPTSYEVALYKFGVDAQCNTKLLLSAAPVSTSGSQTSVVFWPYQGGSGSYHALVRANWIPEERPGLQQPNYHANRIAYPGIGTFSPVFTIP